MFVYHFLVSDEMLQKSINTMQGNLRKLEKELEIYRPLNDPEDQFIPVMKISFLTSFFLPNRSSGDVTAAMLEHDFQKCKTLVESAFFMVKCCRCRDCLRFLRSISGQRFEREIHPCVLFHQLA